MKFTGEDKHPFSLDGETVFIPGHVGSLAIVCCRDEMTGQESEDEWEKREDTHF
jgi:hypothetical protein